MLYEKYGITYDEKKYIESMIKPMWVVSRELCPPINPPCLEWKIDVNDSSSPDLIGGNSLKIEKFEFEP